MWGLWVLILVGSVWAEEDLGEEDASRSTARAGG